MEWAGESYPGKHQLIIAPDVLAKVKASFRTKGNNPRLQTTSFPSGWLKCADPNCGCYITFDPKTKPPLKGSTERRVFEYFRCANGKRVHKSLRGLHFKEHEIWSLLDEPVKAISMDNPFADQVRDEFKRVHAEFKKQKLAEVDGFKDGLKGLEGAEDRLYDELRGGILDESAYKRQLQRIRDERSRFVDLLAKADLEIWDAVLEIADRAITLCIDAESRYKSLSPAQRVEMLKTLLSHPLLQGGADRKLKYSLKVEFAGLAEARSAEAEGREWRPVGDLNPCRCRERAVSWARLDERDVPETSSFGW